MSGYVLVSRSEDDKDGSVELPSEEDGSVLLSVVQSQFEGACGLKYRNPSTGGWRAIKLSDGILHPPDTSGWGDTTYIIVMGAVAPKTESNETSASFGGYAVTSVPSVGYDGSKRIKLDVDEPQVMGTNNTAYVRPSSPSHSNEDLIILGLEWTVTTDELKQYFEKFGEIVSAEVKTDPGTGKSRGFGFIRFADPQIREKVYDLNHAIKGRKVDVKYPKPVSHSAHPTKLFIGCLPLKPEVERDELEAHFSEFGKLTDVYIPRPYRGFGFITFGDPAVAQRVISMQHTLRKSQLNISFADPKGAVGSVPKVPPLQYQQHYPQQAFNAYPNYGYGQYAAQYGQAGYPHQPQVSAAYTYDGYTAAVNTVQTTGASYDRAYADGQTHPHQPQYATPQQQQTQRSMPSYPVQSLPPSNHAYSHPHYQAQTYAADPQQYHVPPQARTSPPRPANGQEARQPPYPPRIPIAPAVPGANGGVEQPVKEYPRNYDPKSIWQNY